MLCKKIANYSIADSIQGRVVGPDLINGRVRPGARRGP